MKGDFSRETFDSEKHFSRVLMQQGRVQLDSDWNEQGAILLHYLRTLAKDILGAHGGPADDNERGFKLAITRSVSETEVSKGKNVNYEPGEAKKESERKALNEGATIIISPGRYYVHGILVENEHEIYYTDQLGIGSTNQPPLEEIRDCEKDLLFYLDVWERSVTYIQYPHIREVALGTPDTCSRSQVVWQVKVVQCQADTNSGELEADWAARFSLPLPVGTGKLRARARQENTPTYNDLCVVSPQSRYRGLENQLYRVEVHRGGKLDDGKSPTFKWSRENGSVIFPIRSVSGDEVILEHLGHDQHLTLKPGDWVEIMDERIAMRAQTGPLAQVREIRNAELSVSLCFPNDVQHYNYNKEELEQLRPYLCRWDHNGDEAAQGAIKITDGTGTENSWIELEDGVHIQFEAGEYCAGDYWLVPARVAAGDIEWPDELDREGKPRLIEGEKVAAAMPPRGPHHYYAPLWLMKPDKNGEDCRYTIKNYL